MYVAATRGRLEAEAGLEPMRSPEQRNVNVISWQRQSERKILGTRGRRPGNVATGSMQKHPIDPTTSTSRRREDEAAPVTRSCVRFNVEGVDPSSPHYNL